MSVKQDEMPLGSREHYRDLARESALEFQKLVITLSTAAVGVFFGFYTMSPPNPPLLHWQRILVVVALGTMSIASLFGMFSWVVDVYRNAEYARQLPDINAIKNNMAIEKMVSVSFFIMFALGMVSSAIFVVCRIF